MACGKTFRFLWCNVNKLISKQVWKQKINFVGNSNEWIGYWIIRNVHETFIYHISQIK